MPKDHCYYIFTKGSENSKYVPSGVWSDLSCACHSFLTHDTVGVWSGEPVFKLRWVKWKSDEYNWQIEQLDEGIFDRREMRLRAKEYRRNEAEKRREEAEKRRRENLIRKQEKERRKQMRKMRSDPEPDLQG